jgi:hypothetical protein
MLPYNVSRLFFPKPRLGGRYGTSAESSLGESWPFSHCDIVVIDLALVRFVEILKHNPGPQMSYQVGFCFWLLTFDQEIAEQINKYVTLHFPMMFSLNGCPKEV